MGMKKIDGLTLKLSWTNQRNESVSPALRAELFSSKAIRLITNWVRSTFYVTESTFFVVTTTLFTEYGLIVLQMIGLLMNGPNFSESVAILFVVPIHYSAPACRPKSALYHTNNGELNSNVTYPNQRANRPNE